MVLAKTKRREGSREEMEVMVEVVW